MEYKFTITGEPEPVEVTAESIEDATKAVASMPLSFPVLVAIVASDDKRWLEDGTSQVYLASGAA